MEKDWVKWKMTREERKMKREVFWYKVGSIGKDLACALVEI
jgi:hypothetical protein